MKTQLNLRELAERIMNERDAKADYIADTRNVEMLLSAEDKPLLHLEGNDADFGITSLAHQQLGQRLQIPKKHYDRLLADHPDLLVTEVNALMHREPERRMIRTLHGNARAVLSDRYRRMDNDEVAETVLPVLEEIPDVQIVSCAITDSKLYIKAVAPRTYGEVKVGDVVQAGVAISNSEVGLGAIKIEPLVYRLRCLNGMILPDGRFRAYHVGARASTDEAVYELLSDETREADDKTILLKVRDVLKASVDQAVFDKTLSKMWEAAEDKIEGNPVKAVEQLAKRFTLNEKEQGGVLRNLIEGGDLSRWGLLNAVTRLSQDVDDYDRATELETVGGVILQLPKPEWNTMALAA